MSLAFESAVELVGRLRRKEISSRELTELYLRRIEKYDGILNAVVVRDFDQAREAASRADERLAAGANAEPLAGLPITIKEAYNVEGQPTTWGIPELKDNLATAPAESVRRYREAGAHLMGKTNVPLNLGDFQSYNEIYGTTGNPWNPERTPGGSSGGSAAALAAGLTALESGSDIGGSIRNPAHYCGVYGHKPTHGIVPDQGHALPGIVASPDIAVVGPMARSAEDLSLAMSVLAGADPFHEDGWKLELPAPRHKKLSDFRVALWPTDAMAPVSTEIADRVQQVGDRLASLGATVSDTARPSFEPKFSHNAYLYMLNGVMSAGLPPDMYSAMQQSAAALDPADDSPAATMLRSSVQSHRDWVGWNHQRARLRQTWKSFFQDWDLVLCPQSATTAFPHDHSPLAGRKLEINGEERPYFEQLFWAGLITVSYLPSTVFPTGPAEDGLPVGLQAVGGEFQDATCIEFARLIAEEFGGFRPPPGYEADE